MRQSRNWFVIGLVMMLLAVPAWQSPARAGEMLLRAGGFEDTTTAAAPRTPHNGANGTKYVTGDFLGTGTETCTVVHFKPFTDYSPGANMFVDFDGSTTGTSVNNSVWRIDLGCITINNSGCTGSGTPRACCSGSNAGNCNNVDTITLSPGTTFQIASASASANGAFTNNSAVVSGSIDETGCTSATPVIAKICRDPANASDTNTDTFQIGSFRFRW